MPRPWTLLDSHTTAEGRLDLHRRGEDEYMISIAGRVLMSSLLHRTELAVAELACERIRTHAQPRVLIGGLGLGYTLRAVLDALPRKAEVTVAELTGQVVRWCRGPLSGLTTGAVDDPRVRVHEGDVTGVIRQAAASRPFDAIVLDLYEGPRTLPRGAPDPLYGRAILERTAAALTPGGVYAVWAEDPNPAFEQRLQSAGLQPTLVRCGGKGPRHAVYVATKPASAARPPRKGGKGRRSPRG